MYTPEILIGVHTYSIEMSIEGDETVLLGHGHIVHLVVHVADHLNQV